MVHWKVHWLPPVSSFQHWFCYWQVHSFCFSERLLTFGHTTDMEPMYIIQYLFLYPDSDYLSLWELVHTKSEGKAERFFQFSCRYELLGAEGFEITNCRIFIDSWWENNRYSIMQTCDFSGFFLISWFLRISLCLKFFSWKKRSSHQGKKEVACIVSKLLVSYLWGCGEFVNPPKILHPGGSGDFVL